MRILHTVRLLRMEDFLKMDVFFVVATIAVVVLAALVSVALYYVVRLLRTLMHISEEVEEETKAIRGDIEDVRRTARREGLKAKHVLAVATKAGKRVLSHSHRKT